ncbi:alpha-amylase family glycosyl hydrolase [Bacteroidota bacterium]
MNTALLKLTKELKNLSRKKYRKKYFVPSIWVDPYKIIADKLEGKPATFFLSRIEMINKIAKRRKISLPENDWTKHAFIYNMFVRYTTAYDHDDNSIIDIEVDDNTFRETGTFLKSIALLPYLHSLGINTIYLLPITSIGIDGRKGNLGSPYAIRNPYKLDENLAEPILNLTVEEQFNAFVEAAHMLGMKVVLEFVFRTASKDSDLALEHPEWFYWIKEKIKDRGAGSDDEKKYGSPVFTEKELKEIKEKVATNDFIKLPVPHKEYLEMFTDVPKKVARIENKIVGILSKLEKTTCRIPGAFADWPPDDLQPAWSDVTYLRLYGHPSFNYIAYNSVRMYEQRLEQNQYRIRSLWDNICNIIPYYQQNFGIDGVMIDMGHALPHDLRSMIVETARKENPDFVFWEENFTLTKKSVKDGYNAAVGYLPFDLHINWKVQKLLKYLSEEGSPIPFFGTAETHNTHRTAAREGNMAFSKFAWALINFLPSIPFVLSGFELEEKNPINTGLCFENEEIEQYPADRLPLFSVSALDWDGDNEFTIFIRKIVELRTKYIDTSQNFNPKTMDYVESSSDDIASFIRKFSNRRIIFIGNMNVTDELYFSLKVNEKYHIIRDVLSGRIIHIANGWVIYNLKPLEFIIGEIE